MTAKVKREIKRWPKSENEALRDDVAAGRRRLHIRSICPSPREATTASGVDNAAPPIGRYR
ncbi:lysis protein [Escherichia coli]|nr:lysis protein [Escherichia coli]EGM8303800.1 lysis protein [Escherichia coli]HAY5084533.1 lysis protein [Escherichia coli]